MHPNRIIELVRDFAALHGQNLSEKLFQNLSGVSPLDIARHFSTWNNLRAAAGLAPKSFGPHATTPADVLVAFESALKKHGPRLSLQTFTTESGISERVNLLPLRELDPPPALRRIAPLSQRQPAGANPLTSCPRQAARISPEQILDRLCAVVREHGENISIHRFCQLTRFSQRLICSRFGCWSNLRRAAGLTPHAKIAPRFTRDDLLDDLFQVYHRTGTDPKMHSYRYHGGQISTVTILRPLRLLAQRPRRPPRIPSATLEPRRSPTTTPANRASLTS